MLPVAPVTKMVIAVSSRRRGVAAQACPDGGQRVQRSSGDGDAAAVADVRLTGVDADERAGRGAHEFGLPADGGDRSEERRVGRECRARWAPYDRIEDTV